MSGTWASASLAGHGVKWSKLLIACSICSAARSLVRSRALVWEAVKKQENERFNPPKNMMLHNAFRVYLFFYSALLNRTATGEIKHVEFSEIRLKCAFCINTAISLPFLFSFCFTCDVVLNKEINNERKRWKNEKQR